MSPVFLKECPTCGRSLEIRVEHLGREVACLHCRGRFIASISGSRRHAAPESESLLTRANRLLAAQREA